MQSEKCLRPAKPEDAEIILKWRNDKTSRENSFNTMEIDLESHLKWYTAKLLSDSCLMYILEVESEPVAMVRGDLEKEICEISYMVSPEKRGKGYGRLVIELFEDELLISEADIDTLVAFTKDTNEPSKKCFIGNGYTELSAGDIKCYIKNIGAR